MSKNQLPIIYSGFYDAPLAFIVKHEGTVYLFWRGFFNDEIDDFPRDYEVYPTSLTELEIEPGDWEALAENCEKLGSIGKISMKDVVFDDTVRKYINIDTFDKLTPK